MEALFEDYYARVRTAMETAQRVLDVDGPGPEVNVAADVAALRVREIVLDMLAEEGVTVRARPARPPDTDHRPTTGAPVPELKGFAPPYTSTGPERPDPRPPWFYSGDLLTVEYRTDVERVRALLPDDVDLAEEDPGAVAFIWADWQSCSTGGAELLDPARSQYKEAFAVVRCRYQGTTYSRCVLIWVTTDFAIARGLHQGYPKKLGSIHQTRPMPFGRGAPRIEAGARFGATLAAYDHRLAQAVVTLTEPSDTNGFVNSLPMLHHRRVRPVERGADGLGPRRGADDERRRVRGRAGLAGRGDARPVRLTLGRPRLGAAGARDPERLLRPGRHQLGRRYDARPPLTGPVDHRW